MAAKVAARIAEMRAGQLVEYGPANPILYEPTHAYTRELLAVVSEIPRPGQM